MLEAVLKYPKALAVSVLFHFVIIIALIINFQFFDKPKPDQLGKQVTAIQAKVIDSKQLEETKYEKNMEKVEQRKNELKKIALEKKANELKQKKENDKKIIQQQKEAEIIKKAAIKKNNAEKEKEKLKAQKKAKAEAKVLAKQKEDLKLAKEVQKKQLAEKKKKQAAEKRRKVEQEQKIREMALQAKIENEELSRLRDIKKSKYTNQIRELIERNWRKPKESAKIASCEVRVLQGPGGYILEVIFGPCNGSSETYRNSIERAVWRSDPLPLPGDKTLFEREINLIFVPK
jgi:colicin import membrane protein